MNASNEAEAPELMAEENDADVQEQPANGVLAALVLLQQQGADHFDPLRFRFIETMVRRAPHQNEKVRGVLQQKISLALAELETRFNAARDESTALLESISLQFPQSLPEANVLFEKADFSGVRNLSIKLRADNISQVLAELTQSLHFNDLHALADSMGETNPQSRVLDEILREQEKKALLSVAVKSGKEAASAPHVFRDLKAMRISRTIWAKLKADKRVALTFEQLPENAGPLNSLRLVIQSLSKMHDISPDYLQRFMAYADTLLWLEQTTKKPEPVAEKVIAKRTRSKR